MTLKKRNYQVQKVYQLAARSQFSRECRKYNMIELRNISVHNLKGINLDLPLGKLIVICGRSGSGKSSLAIDTLYAEGQRRYIETFSAYARQFLEKYEKPDASRIQGIPVSVAVTGRELLRSNRGTVGTSTEVIDYLRMLFAKVGHVFCPLCGNEIVIDSPETIRDKLSHLQPPQLRADSENLAAKILIAFVPTHLPDRDEFVRTWRERGFVRCIAKTTTDDPYKFYRLDDNSLTPEIYNQAKQFFAKNDLAEKGEMKNDVVADQVRLMVVVDRLVLSDVGGSRFVDSVELSFRYGDGSCSVFVYGAEILQFSFSRRLSCGQCNLVFPQVEPELFSFNSSHGACPTCAGSGCIKVAKDDESQNDHKIDHKIDQVENANKRNKKARKIDAICPECSGKRLRAEALAVKIGGKNIVELSDLSIKELRKEMNRMSSTLSEHERAISRVILEQIDLRLGYLESVGVGYLVLSRLVSGLSGGERRRVSLAGALSSSLVEIMYVLDEPTIGLHPHDTERLLSLIYKLRDNGNTLIVVEHEERFLLGADQVVEIGLGAGDAGGTLVFQGTPKEMTTSPDSLTGRYLRQYFLSQKTSANLPDKLYDNSSDNLSGNSSDNLSGTSSDKLSEVLLDDSFGLRVKDDEVNFCTKKPRSATGRIKISGCTGNNLRNISVSIPLGQFCVVTGVSGSGKSSFVFGTLYPAVCGVIGKRRLLAGLPYDQLSISGEITDVVSVDQNIFSVGMRSNPATYIGIFDEIRDVFASVPEARLRNYGAGRFSFNVSGGRCEHCSGDGFVVIDMQFMADKYVRCPECHGKRYNPSTLEVLYRGKNISEVLSMTVREAFTFFRGRVKLQKRLKQLIDVGLDYIRLGQPLGTCSGGELQRLKLASYLVQVRRGGCLLLFDEPTAGLHFADVERLMGCFGMLLDMGHSLLVIEHNLQVIRNADHIIDIGPNAAEQGGTIVAEGTPNEIKQNKNSITGKYI
ncbi:MAG: excinuclease ABC subunit UvrA [Planctomycetaceae bacterium]|nr:excinuclease ABC subunit UvrA [Planctomycetaceae bacterium]